MIEGKTDTGSGEGGGGIAEFRKRRTRKAGPEGEFILAARIPVPQGQFPLSKLITKSCVGWVRHNSESN